ncbi:histidine phosphatase family protein [Corynebacterium kroppenstedtii]|uniref:histidine phosphatase family protein n=1 Tax=Corynebacterium sp. PCR 32 TaxID=3351342 RepID=UPI0030AB9920
MARRLLLLRHGQTDYNATGRMQGQLDTPLSAQGREQARLAAKELAHWDIRLVIASDLSRAAQTADILAMAQGLTPSYDKRLRETHLGQWQARSHEEIDAAHPGQRSMWRHNPEWAPPEGETRVEVATRARAVVDDLMYSFPEWEGGCVLVVAHGGTIAALTSSLLGLPIDNYSAFSGLGNTSWAQLTARPRCHYDTTVATAAGADVEVCARNRAVDTVPVTDFSDTTVDDAQWYLDAWNASALGVPYAPTQPGSAGVGNTYTRTSAEGFQ